MMLRYVLCFKFYVARTASSILEHKGLCEVAAQGLVALIILLILGSLLTALGENNRVSAVVHVLLCVCFCVRVVDVYVSLFLICEHHGEDVVCAVDPGQHLLLGLRLGVDVPGRGLSLVLFVV
jgi:hypothetical protein